MLRGCYMKKRQIINIINFIRGVEPRENTDLLFPVRKQIELMEKYHLKGTFLVQYDALCNPEFTDLLMDLNQTQFEIGVWLEIVQPLAEKAGIKWTGRYPWDWHAHCGFSVGYSQEEREKLVDVLFNDFKDIFGYYPKSLGSWAFDAHTLDYAGRKYGLDAACNCKEQWGTDGYTLWGGYYGQGYYPSRFNAFTPAQTAENQIDTPVFRMLGSDPIYQYDLGVDIEKDSSESVQGVVTLEPVYKSAGGNPSWTDWYLNENFSGNCLTFGYAQAGQENSFGWESMKDGLEYQFKRIAELGSAGRLTNETLGETGRWYKESFQKTPQSSIAALTDWNGDDRRSVWFNCRNYRLNLYAEKGRFWIRDIYIFKENYIERYLDGVCATDHMIYDNLPFVDGNRFSGNGIRAGLYVSLNKNIEKPVQGMSFREIDYREEQDKIRVTFTGTRIGAVSFIIEQKGFSIETENHAEDTEIYLVNLYNRSSPGLPGADKISDKTIEMRHNDFTYSIDLSDGKVISESIFEFEKGKIAFNFE